MATNLRKLFPGIDILIAAHNSLKQAWGTITDPGHTHAGVASAARHHERLVPPAPGTQIHASMAAGGALNVSTAFTRIMPASNIRLSRGGAGVATVYTVTGTRFGSVITETINSNGASDVEGVKIFDTVTSLTSNVDPTVTTTMKTGVMVGLDRVATAIEFLAVGTTDANGVVETGTLNAGGDGFTPTTAPDGSKIFHVRYTNTPATTASATTGLTATFGGTSKFHLDASECTVLSPDATDLASSLLLCNELYAILNGPLGAYPGHLNDTIAHLIADTVNVPSSAKAVDLATAYTRANDMYTQYNAHLSQASVHQNNDATNVASSSSATTQNTLNLRLNDLKAKLNAHMANAVPGSSIRLADC